MRGFVDLPVADGKDRVINVEVVSANEDPVVASHVVVVDRLVDVAAVNRLVVVVVVNHVVFHCAECVKMKKVIMNERSLAVFDYSWLVCLACALANAFLN